MTCWSGPLVGYLSQPVKLTVLMKALFSPQSKADVRRQERGIWVPLRRRSLPTKLNYVYYQCHSTIPSSRAKVLLSREVFAVLSPIRGEHLQRYTTQAFRLGWGLLWRQAPCGGGGLSLFSRSIIWAVSPCTRSEAQRRRGKGGLADGHRADVRSAYI